MLKELRKYEDDGWVYSQVHPSLPLTIFNYNNATQYQNHWDDITLKARGLVLDTNTGEIVSQGFPKFFNYSEGKTKLPDNISNVTVFEKLDGSYIGLFYYADQWIINSRGSFDSDQSKMAENLLKDVDFDMMDTSLTYCFELIHPDNRICVNYGDRKELVFLAAFRGGEEVEYHKAMLNMDFSVVNRYKMFTFAYEELKARNKENEEGYVIKFSNDERCKIKFDDYIKLHSLYTRTSTRDIWKCLMDGDDIFKIIEDAPDEIYGWIKAVSAELRKEFNMLLHGIIQEYNAITLSCGPMTDKEFAVLAKESKYTGFLFSIRNGKDIREKIWKVVKPEHKIFNNYG